LDRLLTQFHGQRDASKHGLVGWTSIPAVVIEELTE
jgi:type I restriction enzyme R subunit